MTTDELKAEVNRIIAGLVIIPPSKRLNCLKEELAKLPPEHRELVLQLVATTVALVEEQLNVKTIKYQTIISVACLLFGTFLAFYFKEPTGIQYLFIRGFFVLGFVGIAVAILVGTVNLKWSITKSLIVTATGGFALLILIYFVNPPPPPLLKPNPHQGSIQTNAP